MDASLSSVSLLPRERIAAITCDRFLLLKTSATRQYYQMQIRTSLSNFASYFLEKRGYVLGFSQLSVGGKDHLRAWLGSRLTSCITGDNSCENPKSIQSFCPCVMAAAQFLASSVHAAVLC